jgi:hypothetical protein
MLVEAVEAHTTGLQPLLVVQVVQVVEATVAPQLVLLLLPLQMEPQIQVAEAEALVCITHQRLLTALDQTVVQVL